MNTIGAVWRFLKVIVLLILLVINCSDQAEKGEQHSDGTRIQLLPLQREISDRKTEISGLAWYRDQLVILPQYPSRFSQNGTGAVFSIAKSAILNHIDGHSINEIAPVRIEFNDRAIRDSIDGFQGFEAIQFDSDHVYMLIEADTRSGMKAYLIEGAINRQANLIDLNTASLKSLPLPVNIKNFAYESLVLCGDTVYAFYEANGINVNPHAYAIGINRQTGVSVSTPFPTIEFRITDATAMDKHHNLWVINYFWPGDYHLLAPGRDSIRIHSGITDNFSEKIPVERLIELHFNGKRFELTRSKPINLVQETTGESRNWEGIVELDDRGFIIATDKHPQTILAFVPHGKDTGF